MPPKPTGRPRGRPAKAGGPAKPATPLGKPRGRPRKSDVVATPAEPDTSATPSARPRGRPRKSDAVATPATSEKPAAPSGRPRGRPPKSGGPAPKPTPSGRPRGRPPKAGGPAAKPVPSGRPRGRPPKARAAAKPTTPAGATRVAKATTKAKNPSPSFNLLKAAIGSYDVTCAEIAGNWGDGDDTYTLDISKYEGGNGLIGDFNFNILEGTMLFAESQAGLDQLVGNAAAGDESSEDEDRDDESEALKARGRPAKAKTDTKQSRRLLLQWRGRETDEGQIHYDNTSNTGYIDFTDNQCSKFKGVASFPAVGQKVPFEGVRVGDDPGHTATPWTEFSESAYDKANVARW